MVYCKTENCKQSGRYGYEYKVSLACTEHREKDMVNVVTKRCAACLTSINPSFGYAGEKATHCSKCKEDNMVNIRGKKCAECKIKEPVFGIDENKPATHCSDCKSEEMTNVRRKKCIVCKDKTPSFGTEGTNSATHCSGCKTDELVNLTMKKCIICNKVSPSYGIDSNKTATHCSKCKTEEMIDVKSQKCSVCLINRATYGFEMNKFTHCAKCKSSEMICVNGKRCKMENCLIHIYGSKYEGYCTRCYVHLNPDKPLTYNYKTKERTVVEFIFENYKDYKWIWDRKICNGLSRRRPDLLLDLIDQVIVIEIDENQHRSYDCSCSNSRLMELSQDVNHKPMVFLRFNPDEYIDKKNVKISSCFSIMPKTGLLKINNEGNWNRRLKSLKIQIDYWIKNRTDKTVEIIQLYYNQN